jgi:hypothetical protein
MPYACARWAFQVKYFPYLSSYNEKLSVKLKQFPVEFAVKKHSLTNQHKINSHKLSDEQIILH